MVMTCVRIISLPRFKHCLIKKKHPNAPFIVKYSKPASYGVAQSLKDSQSSAAVEYDKSAFLLPGVRGRG